MSQVTLTPAGRTFLQPTMIRHLAKMVGCHLWRGDRDSLILYARILRDLLEQAPKTIEFLTKTDRDRALYVIDCFDQGTEPTPWSPCGPKIRGTMVVPKERLPDGWGERDLCRVIACDRYLLSPMCDVSEVGRVAIEAEAGDGRIDIAFDAGRTSHVVEVKVDRADHRVVGQVQKYMREVGSRIHYNLFDEVCGWVVAPDFTEDAMIHLSEAGVRMIRLSIT